MQSNTKKRVGIIRGGEGEYYDFSLQKGGEIISHIFENLSDKYKPVDILIDREGVWHMGGVPINPGDLVPRVNLGVDLVWNTADSSLSNILKDFSIPHVGVSAFSHALQNSKTILKEHVKKIGVFMPRSIIIPMYQEDFDGPRERYAIKKAKKIFERLGPPWLVRHFPGDSASEEIRKANTFGELAQAIEDLSTETDEVQKGKSILVEEFISEKIVSMHSVSNFPRYRAVQGGGVYTFPIGNPSGRLSLDEKEKLVNITRELYRHVDAKHYLKLDFAFDSQNKIYLLGIELTPDLKPDSHFLQTCEESGIESHSIIEHILEEAL